MKETQLKNFRQGDALQTRLTQAGPRLEKQRCADAPEATLTQNVWVMPKATVLIKTEFQEQRTVGVSDTLDTLNSSNTGSSFNLILTVTLQHFLLGCRDRGKGPWQTPGQIRDGTEGQQPTSSRDWIKLNSL